MLGTPVDEDQLVFEETDETFNTYVYKSKSRRYIIIGSSSTLTTEYRILRADQPDGEFEVFSPRERGVEFVPNAGMKPAWTIMWFVNGTRASTGSR